MSEVDPKKTAQLSSRDESISVKMEAEFVIKEGWVVKESGQVNFLGQNNWRRRWCRLVRNSRGLSWSYYR